MHPQLQTIVDEFRRAGERFDRLRATIPAEGWSVRPEPARWSPIECVAHLNLTAEAFVPRIVETLTQAAAADATVRYRRDFFGWLLWKTLPPPVRFKVRTAAAFVPTADGDPETILGRFEQLHQDQIELVGRCDGLRIDRVKIVSPFDSRVRYNLFSALSILPRHEDRHLLQAGEK